MQYPMDTKPAMWQGVQNRHPLALRQWLLSLACFESLFLKCRAETRLNRQKARHMHQHNDKNSKLTKKL